ncbi:MAG TPA: TetR/AcrR family transcriptional regulator [Thermoleophilaceae bacterium]
MAAERPDGRRTRHAGRRRELLDQATDFVFGRGIAAVSLRPLAAALGVSHRTLLYHFGTKERLFSEILREARTRERMLIAAQLDGEVGFVELLRGTWDRITEHLPFFRVYYEVYGLALQDPDRYAGFLDGVVSDWTDLTADLLEREGLDQARATSLATFVWATCRGLLLDLLTTGEGERVDAAFEELVVAVEAIMKRAAPVERP